MKQIIGEWRASFWVECPHCKEDMDLMSSNQWRSGLFEYFAFFSNEDKLDVEADCEKCKKTFIITGTQY